MEVTLNGDELIQWNICVVEGILEALPGYIKWAESSATIDPVTKEVKKAHDDVFVEQLRKTVSHLVFMSQGSATLHNFTGLPDLDVPDCSPGSDPGGSTEIPDIEKLLSDLETLNSYLQRVSQTTMASQPPKSVAPADSEPEPDGPAGSEPKPDGPPDPEPKSDATTNPEPKSDATTNPESKSDAPANPGPKPTKKKKKTRSTKRVIPDKPLPLYETFRTIRQATFGVDPLESYYEGLRYVDKKASTGPETGPMQPNKITSDLDRFNSDLEKLTRGVQKDITLSEKSTIKPGEFTFGPGKGTNEPSKASPDTEKCTTGPTHGPDKCITEPGKGTTEPEKGTPEPDKSTSGVDKGTSEPVKGTTEQGKGATKPDKGKGKAKGEPAVATIEEGAEEMYTDEFARRMALVIHGQSLRFIGKGMDGRKEAQSFNKVGGAKFFAEKYPVVKLDEVVRGVVNGETPEKRES